MLSVDDADTDLETATVNELQPKRSELYQALKSSANFYPEGLVDNAPFHSVC